MCFRLIAVAKELRRYICHLKWHIISVHLYKSRRHRFTMYFSNISLKLSGFYLYFIWRFQMKMCKCHVYHFDQWLFFFFKLWSIWFSKWYLIIMHSGICIKTGKTRQELIKQSKLSCLVKHLSKICYNIQVSSRSLMHVLRLSYVM